MNIAVFYVIEVPLFYNLRYFSCFPSGGARKLWRLFEALNCNANYDLKIK